MSCQIQLSQAKSQLTHRRPDKAESVCRVPDGCSVQLLKALLFERVADGCDASRVAASDLVKSTQAKQHVLKAVARMFLQWPSERGATSVATDGNVLIEISVSASSKCGS